MLWRREKSLPLLRTKPWLSSSSAYSVFTPNELSTVGSNPDCASEHSDTLWRLYDWGHHSWHSYSFQVSLCHPRWPPCESHLLSWSTEWGQLLDVLNYVNLNNTLSLKSTENVVKGEERSHESQLGFFLLIYGRNVTTCFGPKGPSSDNTHIHNY
jgi:hypothetical protein